nr:hypothetical protein [Kiritimatiellia bacterium]
MTWTDPTVCREFVRAIGDTSLLNSDGSFTEALRLRARRALLAIACGQGERGRDTVKKLVEDAPGLDRQKEAAAAVSPHVAATASRPEYAVGPAVSRAFADYMDYRENRDTGRKWGSLDEYLRQGDMLDQRSEIAESVMRLLDAPNGAALLAETARLYAEAARTEQDGLFGSARTSAEIWRDAAKAVDAKSAERRFSLAVRTARDYSWSALTSKPDMKLAKIEGDREYGDDVARRLADARESVLKAGGRKENNHYLIDIEGEPVEVGKRGILHGWHNRNNDFIYPILGEVMKNAVRVNELDVREELTGKGEKDDQVLAKFVYLGAAVDG